MIQSIQEIMLAIAQRLRSKRLSGNLSQSGLAERSDVSLAVLRQFERTGKISLESLIKLSIALGAEQQFDGLFSMSDQGETVSIDELLKRNKRRQRGRSR